MFLISSGHFNFVQGGKVKYKIALILFFVLLTSACVSAERIKDIADISGIRGNPLTGIGLVTGLAGSGDNAKPSQRMLENILRQSGLVIDSTDIEKIGKSIAVVVVTAELGPFDRPGARIDISVSCIGDAESLQGGILMPTPLNGLDGQVYAVAHGALTLGGWGVSGTNASIKKNHLTVATIPGGATVEQSEIADFIDRLAGKRSFNFVLRNNDFTTAERISAAVNNARLASATVVDAGNIRINIPEKISDDEIPKLIDQLTRLEITVDTPAIVVINERTGTIVVGENVGISAVAISQGSLVVKVKETANVSQPTAMFSDAGTTQVVDETLLAAKEEAGYLVPVPRTVTVAELAKTLNAIGATPTDLVAIFNALKKSGALQAKLEIM
jgi:flagellar P-ring protein precursor FlgI